MQNDEFINKDENTSSVDQAADIKKDKSNKKATTINKKNIFLLGFLLCFVLFSLLLLRIFPLKVNSVADIQSRNILTKGVSMQIDPRKLYKTSVATFAGEELESYLVISEQSDGNVIMLVPSDKIKEMSIDGEVIELRGVIQKKPTNLEIDIMKDIESIYKVGEAEALSLYSNMPYVDARKNPQIPALAVLMIASLTFLLLSFRKKK